MQTLKEYFTAFGHWGWVVLASIVIDVTGVTWSILNPEKPIPTVIWVIFGYLILVFAPIMCFHKIKRERDSLIQNLRKHENTHPNVSIMPINDGKFAYFEIENAGHEKAEFQVQVLEWKGFLQGEELVKLETELDKRGIQYQPKLTTPYYLRWTNNLNLVTNPKYELFPEARNKAYLIDDISLVSLPNDAKKVYRIHLPTNESNYIGYVELGQEIVINIECISSPKLKDKTVKPFRLLLDEKGKYSKFEEMK